MIKLQDAFIVYLNRYLLMGSGCYMKNDLSADVTVVKSFAVFIITFVDNLLDPFL